MMRVRQVVMQLLGENLSVLRKRQPGKRFTIGTTCRFSSCLPTLAAPDSTKLTLPSALNAFVVILPSSFCG